MSGTKALSDAVSGLGRDALDVPVAALAALAVAFAAFAVPADQLAEAVGATGLPRIWPAAQPPLGSTARIALGAAGAIVIFAFVFGLLRLLGRKPARRAAPATRPPRVRRRDLHPDAPTRRPISATLEFGEPGSNEPAAAAVPAWLSPAEFAGPGDEVAANEFVDDASVFAGPVGDQAAGDEPDGEAPAFEEALVEELGLEQPLPEVALHSPTEPTGQDRAPIAPGPDTAPPCSGRSESIAQLMERLEQGLARRQPASESVVRAASPVTVPGPRVSAPRAPAPNAPTHDDRLQSAIDSLQRLASRQG